MWLLPIAGDEIRRVVVESLLPFLKGLFVSRKKKKANSDKMAEALSDTALTEYDQFDDYLEMVIQFGVGHNIILSACTLQARKIRGANLFKELDHSILAIFVQCIFHGYANATRAYK